MSPLGNICFMIFKIMSHDTTATAQRTQHICFPLKKKNTLGKNLEFKKCSSEEIGIHVY